jgi:SAM-dependent methyltransferase
MSLAEQCQSRYWVDGIKYRAADHPVTLAYARPKCELIRRHAGLPAGATALDVGTGNGTLFFSLQKHFRVTGLDLSPELLRSHCAPRRILRADAARLPLASNSYDLVVESCVLHHVRRPPEIVREMARVARQGICLIEPNMRNPLSLLFHALVPEERGALRISARSLGAMLPPGFEVTFAGAVGMVYPNRTPAWLLPLITAFDRPSPLGNVNMLVARRSGTPEA